MWVDAGATALLNKHRWLYMIHTTQEVIPQVTVQLVDWIKATVECAYPEKRYFASPLQMSNGTPSTKQLGGSVCKRRGISFTMTGMFIH